MTAAGTAALRGQATRAALRAAGSRGGRPPWALPTRLTRFFRDDLQLQFFGPAQNGQR